jgi:putative ABC transport system permease protein
MGMRERVEGVIRDARVGLRSLLRTPGFTAVCVLTLALGIGATTSLFTVLRALVLAPLPYDASAQLVSIRRDLVVRGIDNYPAAPADVVDYRTHSDAFAAITALLGIAPIMTEGDATERLMAVAATPELFDVLGVSPALGRGFTPEDGLPQPEQDGVETTMPVVLSGGFWRRRFGGDAGILGRTLRFGNATAVVVGVMPDDFRILLPPGDGIPETPDVIMPFTIDPVAPFRGSFFLRTVGRLRPDVTLPVARAQMAGVTAYQQEQYPSAKAAGTTVRLVPLRDDVSAGVRPLLLSMGAAVAFVLLIACVNVANLLLVRAAGRGRELAVRSALGGGRGRLMRQLFIESLVLAGIGGAAGVALAWGALPLLARAIPPELPRLDALELSLPALAFSVGATFVAALVFGTLPALRGAGADVMDALRTRSGVAASTARLRSGLVVLEIALSFVLVVGTGLMVRSVLALQRVDPGFTADGVLTFDATLPPAFDSPESRDAVRQRLREALVALSGVRSVGLTDGLPLTGFANAAPYGGDAELADGDESDLRQAGVRTIGAGYFETLRTPVLAGRELTRDDANTEPVRVLVDRVLAERTWPGESPIGKRIYVKVQMPGIWFEVAGVVGHQRTDALTGTSRETIYFPAGYRGPDPARWAVRFDGDPVAGVPAVRAAVARVDDRILLENVRPMAEYVAAARAPTRMITMFVAAFGLLALTLALVGLYGVLAYLVRERRAEFGVRLALGAEAGTILRLVLRHGFALSALGIAAGVVGALALTRIMAGVLVGVAPTDPTTYAAVASLFVLMAAAASLVPARRALAVDPMQVLRDE